jgi:hypothetical protein
MLDELTWYAPPTLLQSLAKPILLLFGLTEIVVLWVVLVHPPFNSPLKVFYWIEIQ